MHAFRNQKTRRKVDPSLELLDMRIAPAGMGAAATLAAEIKVEVSHVHHWNVALATTHEGSAKADFLTGKISRTEARIGTQRLRLAATEAPANASGNMKGNRVYYPPAPQPPTPGQPPPNSPLASTNRVYYPPAPQPPTPGQPPPNTPANGTSTTTTSVSDNSTGSGNSGTQPTLPANVSVTLAAIYNAYEQDPNGFPADIPATDGASRVIVQGDNVGIQVQDMRPADFATLVADLQNAGMQIQTSSAAYGIVVGMLPIAQLPTVGQLPDAPSVTAEMQPLL